MTFNELHKAILEVCPRAQLDEDNEGQSIVYTDMMIATNVGPDAGGLVPYVAMEYGDDFFSDREANPHDDSMYGEPEGGY